MDRIDLERLTSAFTAFERFQSPSHLANMLFPERAAGLIQLQVGLQIFSYWLE